MDCEGRLLKPERQTGSSGTKLLHFTSSREPNLSHLQLPVVANSRAGVPLGEDGAPPIDRGLREKSMRGYGSKDP